MNIDSVKEQIMAARLPAGRVLRPAGPTGHSSILQSVDSSSPSIPGSGHTPFTVLDRKEVSDGGEQVRVWEGAKMWSDGVLKQRASALDRTVLAISDAAHIVFKKGEDPRCSPVYITSVIRKAWGLSPKELSKQLGRLMDEGVIVRWGAPTKGSHARFTLAPADQGGGFPG